MTTQTFELMQRDVLMQRIDYETQINDDVEKWSCEKNGFKDAHRTWMCVQCCSGKEWVRQKWKTCAWLWSTREWTLLIGGSCQYLLIKILRY